MTTAIVHATIVAILTASSSQLQSLQIDPTPNLFSTEVATIVTHSAELHADASLGQPVVDKLMRGEEAVVIFVQGDWLKVRQAGSVEGWVERVNTASRFQDLAQAQIRSGYLGQAR